MHSRLLAPSRLRSLLPLFPLLLACACDGGGGGPGDGGPDGGGRTYSYRGLAGVSMGAIGTGFLGTETAGRFDALGPLGGALDTAYFLHFFETQPLAGFCTLPELETIYADSGKDVEALDNVAAIEGCAHKAVPTERFEHAMSYNDWWFDDNGGTFDRSSYIDLIEDLAQALGNPAYENPDNPFFPPGIDDSWSCAAPGVIKGLANGGTAPIYNDQFNPDGQYDLITFCDGEESIVLCEKSGQLVNFCAGSDADTFCGANGPAVELPKNQLKSRYPEIYYQEKGHYDPCRPHTERMRMVLAVDIDGDGKRDYGEPVVMNDRERFSDVGADGCASVEEDGAGGCTTAAASPYDAATNPDPNGDDYSLETNALGLEGNWLWESGEPYQDDGLDGVAGSGDFGEGNGSYDLSSGAARWLAMGPRGRLSGWTDTQIAQTDFWFDGGIRDLFNLGVSASEIWGQVNARSEGGQFYQNFSGLPTLSGKPVSPFDFREVDTRALSSRSLFIYGDPNATNHQWRDLGDGAHVGTVKQALDRFNMLFAWFSERFPGGDDSTEDYGSFSELVTDQRYYSESLGSDRMYSIALPPGYFDPANSGKRYPVVYFLHGYGQDPTGMSGANVVFTGYMAEGLLEKMIIVYVDGRCCYRNAAGERDCYEDPGEVKGPGWERECHKGSFYVNSLGKAAGDGTDYGESFLELLKVVDDGYRTKSPETL